MRRTKKTVFVWSISSLLVSALAWITAPAALAQGFGGGTAGGGSAGGSGMSSGSSGFGSSSSGGSGFSGGGTTFAGGGSFSGGTTGSMSGGSTFSGSTAGFNGGTMGGSSTMGGLSATNIFSTFYANPYALGLNVSTGVGTTPSSAFGTPIYGNLSTGTSSYGSMSGGLGGTSGLGGNRGGLGGTSGTTGTAPSFSYVLETGATLSPTGSPGPVLGPRNAGLEQTVLGVLSRSSALPSKRGILVAVMGNTVILRGRVPDPHERQLAEAILRLTPGVANVVNQIQIR